MVADRIRPKGFGRKFDAYKLNKVDCAGSAVDDRQMDTPTVKDYIDTRFETLTSVMQTGFAKIDAKFAGVDAKFAGVDAKFAVADSKLATVAAELRTEIHKGFSDLVKWFVATMIALFVAQLAVMVLLFSNFAARLTPPQAVPQSAPAATAPASPPSPIPSSPGHP